MTDTIDMFAGSGGLTVPRRAPPVLSFGKHKGQPFEVLLQDSGYALWLMNSMFAKLESSHPDLLAFLVSRYGVPDRTPVHNKLQNKFLDEAFCMQFALTGSAQLRKSIERLSGHTVDVEAAWRKHVTEVTSPSAPRTGWDDIDGAFAEKMLPKKREGLIHEAADVRIFDVNGKLVCNDICPVVRLRNLELEVEGADVRFTVEQGYSVSVELHQVNRRYGCVDTRYLAEYGETENFRIEVKPILGDDYPAVLRTMKATNCTHLLVAEYCGEGASWAQVVQVFALSKITAVMLDDVEQVSLSPVFEGIPVKPLTSGAAKAVVEAAYERQLQVLSKDCPAVPIPL